MSYYSSHCLDKACNYMPQEPLKSVQIGGHGHYSHATQHRRTALRINIYKQYIIKEWSEMTYWGLKKQDHFSGPSSWQPTKSFSAVGKMFLCNRNTLPSWMWSLPWTSQSVHHWMSELRESSMQTTKISKHMTPGHQIQCTSFDPSALLTTNVNCFPGTKLSKPSILILSIPLISS